MCKPEFETNPARVQAFFAQHSIPYHVVRHAPAATMADCAALQDRLCCVICKNLLLRTANGSAYYLLMLRPDRRFVTKEISKLLGTSRLSFATPEDLARLLHTPPGSLSVTSLIFDEAKRVRLAMDDALCDAPLLGCHASLNTETLTLPFAVITEQLLPALGVEPVFLHLDDLT